jgi:undecaprenyl diphosphate synthase
MENETPKIPQHIAIIMDGNRRWAKQNKLQALQGHKYVADKVLEPLIERAIERGVKFVTLWAFSTENWDREANEVAGIMDIFRQAFTYNAEVLHRLGVKLHVIGDLSRFPQDIQDNVRHWLKVSQNNSRISVTFALNYGGRDEILRALKALASKKNMAEITAADLSRALDTNSMPEPDMIIRPGGEKRLSGFMTWQSVYAELYFTDVLMPDFTPAELDKALEEYSHRQRRFGK